MPVHEPSSDFGPYERLAQSDLAGPDNDHKLARITVALLGGLTGMENGRGALGGLSGALGGTGAGGVLPGLVDQLTQAGLGAKVQSWIATGKNQPVTPEQIEDALGYDTVDLVASGAGIAHGEARDGLALALPRVISALTPDGRVPPENEVQDRIASLVGR
jgi:uncharacterized protein YidB (DUF937 family)